LKLAFGNLDSFVCLFPGIRLKSPRSVNPTQMRLSLELKYPFLLKHRVIIPLWVQSPTLLTIFQPRIAKKQGNLSQGIRYLQWPKTTKAGLLQRCWSVINIISVSTAPDYHYNSGIIQYLFEWNLRVLNSGWVQASFLWSLPQGKSDSRVTNHKKIKRFSKKVLKWIDIWAIKITSLKY